jgi:glutamine amidotransferase/cyclase
MVSDPADERVAHVLDYGAGNVASIRNAIHAVGWRTVDVTAPAELAAARVLVFPGVGAFGSAMAFLNQRGFAQPLREYIAAGRPYLGICLGMQTLFDSSEECPGEAGLGVIPGPVRRFPSSPDYAVPHIGWNGIRLHQAAPALAHLCGSAPDGSADGKVYFVHSYRAAPSAANAAWVAATTDYGDGPFISAVQRGSVFATQFHPEKSGAAGLDIFRRFLEHAAGASGGGAGAGAAAAALARVEPVPLGAVPLAVRTRLARRIVA